MSVSKLPRKQTAVNPNLFDPVAERLVITSILEHGVEVFHDINSLIKDRDFYFPENKLLYSALDQLIVNDGISKPTIASIIAKLNTLDKESINKYEMSDYLSALTVGTVSKDEFKPSVERMARFSLCRGLIDRLEKAVQSVKETDGKESILQIINKAEKPISDFTESLVVADEPIDLSNSLESFIEFLAIEKPEFRGIPTGFPKYDKALGGGLRFPGVHLLGARVKVGKSFIGLNIANYVSKLGIPVLYLDTELTRDIMMARWAALISGVPIDQIESGSFANNMQAAEHVAKIVKATAGKQPFTYFNISGRNHEEWISIMRRWVMRKVGFNADGTTKPCLIVLDYLKLMSLDHTGDFAEWQWLGQVISDLHNFGVKYNLPIWSPVQLNREGIGNDHQGIISGSDRLAALCSSFTVLRNKTSEDYAADPETNGNKKLVVMFTRFGPGTPDGEYINIKADLSRSLMVEGPTNIEVRTRRPDLVATQGGRIQDQETDLYDDDGTIEL